jgi:hypothetical protein
MDAFGFSITSAEEERQKNLKSFVEPNTNDGAVTVATGGTFGTYIDLDGTIRTEAELVARYREMSLQPEVDKAINEVINEAIVTDTNEPTIELVLDSVQDLPPKIKDALLAEFDFILKLYDFKNAAYDLFRQWYIDGRTYHHVLVDEKNPELGIQEIRQIDPRKIRKIREVLRKRDDRTSVILQKTKEEYYLYNDKGLQAGAKSPLTQMGQQGIKIKKGSIIHTVSGLTDTNNTQVLSYLHPAIKQLNQLRALEDATTIYHLSRAPERRIFYVEVGNLPNAKAEQHLRNQMIQHKNKLSYNASTGEMKDDRRFQTMLEDYWLPSRDGKGTKIDVLSGGTQLSQLLESVEYFQNNLYKALQVPMTRMAPDAMYNIGRATEITRDEINFSKFINRLRNRFVDMFIQTLEKQVVLKNIMTIEDFDYIKRDINFKFAKDNYFEELKEQEILNERLIRLRDIDPFRGRYFSNEWIRRSILKQTDEDMAELDAQIADEINNKDKAMQYYPELMQPDNNPDKEETQK